MRPYEVLKGICLEKLILRALRGKKYQYILNRNDLQKPSFSFKFVSFYLTCTKLKLTKLAIYYFKKGSVT